MQQQMCATPRSSSHGLAAELPTWEREQKQIHSIAHVPDPHLLAYRLRDTEQVREAGGGVTAVAAHSQGVCPGCDVVLGKLGQLLGGGGWVRTGQFQHQHRITLQASVEDGWGYKCAIMLPQLAARAQTHL